MNNKCRTCLYNGMCYTDGNCGYYATTNEEYEDRMNQNYIDEERQEFYDEWFEYIDQYE